MHHPWLQLLLVTAVAFALVGTAYSDRVSKLRAQDECTYANSAHGLAHAGGWLTRKVLGRYLLFKPPLLVWLAGLSLNSGLAARSLLPPGAGLPCAAK